MTNLTDITTKDDVQRFVHAFYDKVNADDLLSPVFNNRAHVDWESHLPKMVKFWSSILLDSNEYRGQPFDKHAEHAQYIHAEHFERWLSLFESTLRELFAGEKTDLAIMRAKSIGSVFQYKLEFIRINEHKDNNS
jgi:hemoglobin